MMPYISFLYFGILLYLAVPTILIGLIGKKRLSTAWFIIAGIIMLLIQYWVPKPWIGASTIEIFWLLILYALLQWLVIRGLLYSRSIGKNTKLYQAGLFIALASSLLPLLSVKASPVFHTTSLIAFVGISYITFRVLDVVINIHDGLITQVSFVDFLCFILFFPTISSGPIDTYRRFMQDFTHQRTRREFLNDVSAAVQRIFTGFLYYFILAALIKTYWLTPAGHENSLLGIISYMYAYSFYLFFDFAGYSAFAIGIGYLFGIHTPENFNRPFFSPNIKEFWTRWHITLSVWFRNNIYNRFAFAALKGQWLKNKYLISALGYVLTMGLMGLWHGFTWYYFVYGLYMAGLLAGYDLFLRLRPKRTSENNKNSQWKYATFALSVFITFTLVSFGFLLFSGRLDPSFQAYQAPIGLSAGGITLSSNP